jgi:hypothetical protein
MEGIHESVTGPAGLMAFYFLRMSQAPPLTEVPLTTGVA